MNTDPFWYGNITASIPPVWLYVTGLFSFGCLLCGILSNGFVIFVFVKNSALRRPRNFLLVNLAVTDIGLLLTNNTLHIIASFNKQWPFGRTGCNIYALCGGICGLTSISTMAAIALTRLAAVINPFSSLKLTGTFTLKCIVGSWIYGTIWILPPLFGWSRFIFEGFGTTCTFDYVSKALSDRLYMLLLVFGGFIVPLLIIVVSYTFILMKLSERGRRLMYPNDNNTEQQFHLRQIRASYLHHANSLNDKPSRSETITPFEGNESNHIAQNIRRTEVRATRTALLVCAIFCLAWGPYTMIAIFWQIGCDSWINAYTTATLGLFAKTAACVNPMIYALASSKFREQIYFCCSILCFCRKRPSNRCLSYHDSTRKRLAGKSFPQPTSSDLSL